MYVSVVILQNTSRLVTNNEWVGKLGWDILQIVGMEILVDWSKHAFVTKFNRIPCNIYGEYCKNLATDVRNAFKNNSMHHEQVTVLSRRLGFLGIPLVCLVARAVTQHIQRLGYSLSVWNSMFGLLVFACLFAAKVLLGLQVIGFVSTHFFDGVPCDRDDSTHFIRPNQVARPKSSLERTKHVVDAPISPFISARAAPHPLDCLDR
eukprot:TRINITY_DN5557_c0_g1_i4.p1 TRINITY_DN5557_c0_g1~~TRINITY_DN5557_c0_g1_i4.p1  ORF type:complete len:206 (-),score=47.92 TRINITY_DN5557_c0_g1_i4:252-869(-)